jgi:hypothetical protein
MQTTRNRRSEARQMRIVVRGRLSRRIVGGFDGFAAHHQGGRTELVGEVADQAQLHGLLNRIRDLGLELIELTPRPAGRVSRPEGESPCHR